MFTIEDQGNGTWLLWDNICGEGFYMTISDMEEVKDLITATLQETDYLKTKGEVQ